MARVELRDGQWAELRERITHGQHKTLIRTFEANDAVEFGTALVREFVRAWHVLDPDGEAIPLADADAIDRAPSDIVLALAEAANEAFTDATVPKGTTPPSSDDSS